MSNRRKRRKRQYQQHKGNQESQQCTQTSDREHSADAHESDASHSGENAQQRQQPALESRRKLSDALIQMFYGLDAVAVFTFLLTIVTAIQVWAFIQTERASVLVVRVSADTGALKANHPLAWKLTIQDSGKSDAQIVDGNASTAMDVRLLETPVYNRSQSGFRAIIPAGTMFGFTSRVLQPNGQPHFSAEQLNAINIGKKKLYVFGYLEYRDIFSWLFGSQTTGFCFVYDPLNDPNQEAMFDICGPDGAAYTYRH